MSIEKQINITVKETGLETAKNKVDNLSDSIKKADIQATNLDATFEEIYGDLQPLTTRMGEAEDRLYELGLAGKQTTKEYQDLLKVVANYRRTQIQTDLVVDAASQNLSQNLTGALSAAAGGFSVVQGAMGAMGAESSEVNDAILKVQSAMAISTGFDSVKEGVKSFSALKNVIMANTVVSKIATTVQKLWNIAISSNPIGALVAVISLAIAGIAGLVSWFIKSSEANKSAMNATIKNSKALENQSKQANKNTESLKINNDQQYELAKASGASSQELRKLSLQHAKESIELNKKNALLARSTFLRERETLAMLEQNDASDEVIEKQKELTKKAYEELNKQRDNLKSSTDEYKNIVRKNEVEIVAEKKSARDKDAENAKVARQKRIDDAQKQKEEAIQLAKDLAKAKLDAEMKSAQEALGIVNELNKNVETPAQKEEREYNDKKVVLEENNLSTQELTRQHNDAMFKISEEEKLKQKELEDKKLAEEKLLADDKIKIAQAVAQQKKDIQEAEFALASGAINFLKEIGGKNKAIQKASIIAENAIGIGKMIIANNAANIGALATPQAILTSGASAVPVITANNITTALGVATTLASTSKALSSVGGGGATATAPSVGGSGGATATAPSFNLVAGTGSNQIAQGLANGQAKPIQAYVVSGAVTNAQAGDRNIINDASI